MLLKYPLKLTVLLLIFTVACKKTPQKSIKSVETRLFSLETTSCMGPCPVFTFIVYSNGACTYNGGSNVEKLGNYTGMLTPKQFKSLKNYLSESDFFNIELKNNNLIKDLPTSYFYYNDGNKEKKITYYYPKNKSLDGLKNISLDLIKETNWVEK